MSAHHGAGDLALPGRGQVGDQAGDVGAGLGQQRLRHLGRTLEQFCRRGRSLMPEESWPMAEALDLPASETADEGVREDLLIRAMVGSFRVSGHRTRQSLLDCYARRLSGLGHTL
jgi:hypothetical protein